MIGVSRNTAEIEYAVMLAVLNFQTEFMKSHYARAKVHIFDDVIEVVLTKTTTIPAEQGLAQSPGGRALLLEVQAELFRSGEWILRTELERILRVRIQSMSSGLDAISGTTTVTIKLAAPLAMPDLRNPTIGADP